MKKQATVPNLRQRSRSPRRSCETCGTKRARWYDMKQQDGSYKPQSPCSSCMWGKNSSPSDGDSSEETLGTNYGDDDSCNENGDSCEVCKNILHDGYDCSMCRACFNCCLKKDGCPDWTLSPMALKGNQTSRSRRRSPSCTYLCMECPTDRPQGKCVHKAGHENSPWKEHICQRCIDFEEDPTGQSFRPAPVHKDRVHYPSRKVAFDEVPLPNVGRRPQTFLSTN